jgi:hypothetical protein
MEADVTTCANCSETIGKLEPPPLVWQDHTVCARCHARLAVAAAPPDAVAMDRALKDIRHIKAVLAVVFIAVVATWVWKYWSYRSDRRDAERVEHQKGAPE